MQIILVICLAFALFGGSNSSLVWISIGGFRGDYLTTLTTPEMVRLFQQEGVVSSNHKSMFATTTLPNHFSQATGLTQEHHGIINDFMFDDELGFFQPSNISLKWWNPEDSTVPIWTFNELKKGSSAVLGWPGAGVLFSEILPNFTLSHFNKNCDVKCKLNLAYEQIKLDKHNLVMLYIDDLDLVGRLYGPSSVERINTTKVIDSEIGKFFKKLEKLGTEKVTDFIISSDHGMTETPLSKRINIQDITSGLNVNVISTGPVLQLNCDNITAEILKLELTKDPRVNAVYLSDEIPDEYLYKNGYHVPTITAIANDTYTFVQSEEEVFLGGYGYPQDVSPNMEAFFAIRGPSVLKNAVIRDTTQTDLYTVACTILGYGYDCYNNDGVLPNGLLRQQNIAKINLILIIAVPICVTFLAIIIILSAYYNYKKKSNKKSKKSPEV